MSWQSEAEARRTYAHAARLCDALVGNDDEFAIIAGNAAQALAVARDFVERGGRFAVFKKGIAGSVTLSAEGSFDTGIYAVDVRKPFGAGDAFLGTLVAALLSGRTLEAGVRRASAAAAHVVSRRGCAFAMPTVDELDKFILSHSIK